MFLNAGLLMRECATSSCLILIRSGLGLDSDLIDLSHFLKEFRARFSSSALVTGKQRNRAFKSWIYFRNCDFSP